MSYDDDEDVSKDSEADRMAKVRAVRDELARRRNERGYARIPERRPQPERRLESFDLIAYTSKVTYNTRGDVVVVMVVPHQYHEMAEDLPKTIGKPLHVTVDQWRPLDAVRADTE